HAPADDRSGLPSLRDGTSHRGAPGRWLTSRRVFFDTGAASVNMFSLSGKVIAVVGAGSGIGEAIAIGAADQGASYVACLDLNEAGAAATAARITAAGGKGGGGGGG